MQKQHTERLGPEQENVALVLLRRVPGQGEEKRNVPQRLDSSPSAALLLQSFDVVPLAASC